MVSFSPLKRNVACLLILVILMAGGTATAGGSFGHAGWKKRVNLVRWFDGGDAVLKKGHCGYIRDLKSGYIIRVKRLGGHNHMDLEPADRWSGYLMKKIGRSWHARPAILYANGHFVACSINTMPHGRQKIKNNGFKGQFCLHMLGSKTHGGRRIRRDHQAAIRKAYRWAHG